jgi:hypothetical protein
MPTQTFWCERTDLVRVSLRRFTYSERADGGAAHQNCPKTNYGHDASRVIDEQATLASDWITLLPEKGEGHYTVNEQPHDDPRWPVVCDSCGQIFPDGAVWQTNADPLYRGCPDGKLYTLRDVPPGAMWDASWYRGAGVTYRWWTGDDGISLVVKLPNGHHWMPDSRCSNCTLPEDNVHRCWVRHGDPKLANLTVDKNGVTCAAGAGSILAGDYHGFLQNGVLT